MDIGFSFFLLSWTHFAAFWRCCAVNENCCKSHKMGCSLDNRHFSDQKVNTCMYGAKSQNILPKALKWASVLKCVWPKSLYCKSQNILQKAIKWFSASTSMSLTKASSAGFSTNKCIYSPSHPTYSDKYRKRIMKYSYTQIFDWGNFCEWLLAFSWKVRLHNPLPMNMWKLTTSHPI